MTPDSIRLLATTTAHNIACHLVGNGDVSLEEARLQTGIEIERAIVEALAAADRGRRSEQELREELVRSERDAAQWLNAFNVKAAELRAVGAALSFDPNVDRDLETCARRIYHENISLRFAANGLAAKVKASAHGAQEP